VIQSEIDRKLSADGNLASLGITATVNDGKVILVGTAPSDELKAKVERLVRSIAGVKVVDNQIAVVVN
jgi:osmotically-inducible protein OsmY